MIQGILFDAGYKWRSDFPTRVTCLFHKIIRTSVEGIIFPDHEDKPYDYDAATEFGALVAALNEPMINDNEEQEISQLKKDKAALEELLKTAEKRGMWKFLKACRSVQCWNPMHGNVPYPTGGTVLGFCYGICNGIGDMNENGELDAYNGETFTLKAPIVIIP